jgi:hypothetical protein
LGSSVSSVPGPAESRPSTSRRGRARHKPVATSLASARPPITYLTHHVRPRVATVIITGYKSTRTRKTTPAQRQASQALSAARAPVEHAFSDLKNWRILTRLRLNPAKATILLRALLVLTRHHTTR